MINGIILCCSLHSPSPSRHPLLGLSTLWVRAPLTPQPQLLPRRLPRHVILIQMPLDQIRQCPHKDGRVVQTLRPLQIDAQLVRLLLDLNVQLVQRFDVVRGEGDWDETDVFLTVLGEALDRVGGLRALPCLRADLRLPCKSVPDR